MPVFSHRTRFLEMLVLLVACVVLCSGAKLERGRYENITVALTPKLNQSDVANYIFALKTQFENASSILCHATGGKVVFGSLHLMIPAGWNETRLWGFLGEVGNVTDDFPRTNRRHNADIRVEVGVTDDVLQTKGCGRRGDFIRLSAEDLLTMDKNYAKQLVYLWSRWRYGVFPESASGFHYHPKEDRFVPNSCTDQTLKWKPDSAKSDHCIPDYNATCPIFVTTGENDGIQSSLMFEPSLPNMKYFCNSTTHNPYANTPHNLLCGGRSVWEVIEDNEDLKELGNETRSIEECSSNTINLVLVPHTCRRLYLVFAVQNLTQMGLDSILSSLLMTIPKMADDGDSFSIFHFQHLLLNFTMNEETRQTAAKMISDIDWKLFHLSSTDPECLPCIVEHLLKSIQATTRKCEISILLMTNSNNVTEIADVPGLLTTTPFPTTVTDSKTSSQVASSKPAQSGSQKPPPKSSDRVLEELQRNRPTDGSVKKKASPSKDASSNQSRNVRSPAGKSILDEPTNEESEVDAARSQMDRSTHPSVSDGVIRKWNLDDIKNYEVQIDTVAVGKQADLDLEKIAAITGGHTYYVPDLDRSKLCLLAPLLNKLKNDRNRLDTIFQSDSHPQNFFMDVVDLDSKFDEVYVLAHRSTPHNAMNIVFPLPMGNVTYNHAPCESLTDTADICVLTKPESETWAFISSQAGANETTVVIVAKPPDDEDTLFVSAWMDRDAYTVNMSDTQLLLFAEARQVNGPLSDVTVRVTVDDEEGDVVTLELKDSGFGTDILKGDGIYTTQLVTCKNDGRHKVKVEVKLNLKNVNLTGPSRRYFDLGSVLLLECGNNTSVPDFPVRDFKVTEVDVDNHTAHLTWTELWTNQSADTKYHIKALSNWTNNVTTWEKDGVDLLQLDVKPVGTSRHEHVTLQENLGPAQFLALVFSPKDKTTIMSNPIAVSINVVSTTMTVGSSTETPDKPTMSITRTETPDKPTISVTPTKTPKPTDSTSSAESTESGHFDSSTTDSTAPGIDDQSPLKSETDSKSATAGIIAVIALLVVMSLVGVSYYVFYYRRRRQNDPSYSVGYTNLD